MAGPRVDTSRAPQPGAAGGEFSKAFATVLDALNTSKQVGAVMAQVAQKQRADDMTMMGDFIQNAVKDLSPMLAGGTADAYNVLRPSISKMLGYAGVPEEQANAIIDKAISATPSFAATARRDIAEEAVATPEGTTAAPAPAQTVTTAEPMSTKGAPEEDPWNRMMIGPVTPAKTQQMSEAGSAVVETLSTQDLNDPASMQRTTSALNRVVNVGQAGSTKTSRLADPRVQAMYEKYLGPKWREVLGYNGLGVLPEKLQAEAAKDTLNALQLAQADSIQRELKWGDEHGVPYDLGRALALQEANANLQAALADKRADTEMERQLQTNVRGLRDKLVALQGKFTTNGKLNETGYTQSPEYVSDTEQLVSSLNALNALNPQVYAPYKITTKDLESPTFASTVFGWLGVKGKTVQVPVVTPENPGGIQAPPRDEQGRLKLQAGAPVRTKSGEALADELFPSK